MSLGWVPISILFFPYPYFKIGENSNLYSNLVSGENLSNRGWFERVQASAYFVPMPRCHVDFINDLKFVNNKMSRIRTSIPTYIMHCSYKLNRTHGAIDIHFLLLDPNLIHIADTS